MGLLSTIFLLYILAQLSKKIGEVTTMPAYYRGFFVSQGLIVVALASYLFRVEARLSPEEYAPIFNSALFYSVTFHVPLALGLTIALAITWHYWDWLLREMNG